MPRGGGAVGFLILALLPEARLPAIYYLIQSDPRYRYPIYWTSLLPAGCALTETLLKMPFLQAALGHSAEQPPAIPESTRAHSGAATQICSSVENSDR